MDDWKARAVQKKDYRRGGLEPDPPRVRKKKDKTPKIFKVERRWNMCGLEWWGCDSYLTLEMAMSIVKDMARKDYLSTTKRYRIINRITKEILWESNIE
jgi:hypothetical protein